MYYCKDCNESFREPMSRADFDGNPKYLQQSTGAELVCPICGELGYSWVDNHCSVCGDYYPDDVLHHVEGTDLMICDQCIGKIEENDADRQEERDA